MRAVALAIGGILLCGAASAQDAAATAAPPPDKTIREATERVQNLIGKNHKQYRADRRAFYRMVETEVVPRFDLKYIAQLILARHWRDATPEQRKRFQEGFKDMLIRSYADALLEFHDSVKAEWLPLRAEPGAENVMVQSKLIRQDGPPLPLGFAMRLRDGEWKVYDITIENISLISGFRSQVAAEVRRIGLDGVIERLERGEISKPASDGVKEAG